MIRYIKRSELDGQKYNACIEKSINTRIYAYSWYLDIVADNWDVLVLNDYDAVMPMPWRSKYFIKYIYPPCWTQQLGVFSSSVITIDLNRNFIEHIPKKFKKTTIQFNSDNPISGENVEEKMNYILPLNKPYDQLLSGYNYERRRILKQKKDITICMNNNKFFEEIIELFKETKKELVNITTSDYNRLSRLIDCLSVQNKIKVVSSFDENGGFLGGAFFLVEHKRVTYLFSSLSKKGRSKHAMTIIIDAIIKKYANSNITFDFEGSMISGVAFFFKSFGAKNEVFCTYRKV